jgi:hypothetical protein
MAAAQLVELPATRDRTLDTRDIVSKS